MCALLVYYLSQGFTACLELISAETKFRQLRSVFFAEVYASVLGGGGGFSPPFCHKEFIALTKCKGEFNWLWVTGVESCFLSF